jgi:hypothetical protein
MSNLLPGISNIKLKISQDWVLTWQYRRPSGTRRAGHTGDLF